ncbi:molecular chaperone [Rahnella victoriana]|uniref:fimbria/pilus periplasmic chaperone n=1 Tax=Rahnella victoriana TaxID=1510570 RepID=UPI000BB1F0D5|nr:fimbria/pilus periplasmic chaperone [Rahnella victoriana]PBI80451.1 molecular chaperone [Rahnella victoriana]
MKFNLKLVLQGAAVSLLIISQQGLAAISLDRTRIIFDGSVKSISLEISNQNKKLPYLAQGWLEDASGKKIASPMTVLPPVQRVEPGAKSQVRIQAIPAIGTLPQDRETLFYFNLREIPPKSDKPNTLQIALQTRIKLFYRPMGIAGQSEGTPQEKLTLTKVSGGYQINNPTPFYITLVEAAISPTAKSLESFTPLMVEPKGSASLPDLGVSPVVTYVNDYGGRPKLQFTCSGNSCSAKTVSTK